MDDSGAEWDGGAMGSGIQIERYWQGRERWARLVFEGDHLGGFRVRAGDPRRCYIQGGGGAGIFAGSLAECLRLLRDQARTITRAVDATLERKPAPLSADEIEGVPV